MNFYEYSPFRQKDDHDVDFVLRLFLLFPVSVILGFSTWRIVV
jgi:TRAP-type mannitol/chloroaromatic compound transport system permease small subunit